MRRGAKLRREVLRVVYSALDGCAGLYEPIVRRRHDLRFDRKVDVTSGGQESGARIAIVLIYQPHGVLPSSHATLTHLIAEGFSPWLVANGGLPEADVARLSPLVARLIRRPNYGHDFGGYRDALRVLEQSAERPEELLLLNDSIWFPLWSRSLLLDTLVCQNADLGGAMFERKAGRRHQGHFESYLLRVGPDLIARPEFWRFWRDYPVSSIRRKVLLRGEKGFSAAMLAAGATIAPLASRDLFVARIAEQDDGFLAKTLAYAGYDDPDDAAAALHLGRPGEAEFRDRALAHIGKVAARSNLQETFVYAAMTLFDLPFLKKRMTPGTVRMRQRFSEAVEAGDLPRPDPVIWEELRASIPGPAPSP